VQTWNERPAAGRGPVIAVVGGGASGTLAVIHLLREAARRRVPLRVALIDRHGRHGLGQAYSTTHPAHLLNSPAHLMSALAGDPGQLTRWAEQAEERSRRARGASAARPIPGSGDRGLHTVADRLSPVFGPEGGQMVQGDRCRRR